MWVGYLVFFFFSSRRRHTRCGRDWSSDVCSSDLAAQRRGQGVQGRYAAPMKAALYRQTGPAAAVLQVEEIERPQPGPGEVLVRVRASGVNPTDCKSRAGMTPRPIDGFQVPHMDGAGIIEIGRA